MKQFISISLISIILLASVGCSVQTRIKKIGVDELISDAEGFEQQVKNLKYRYESIPIEYWPDSFVELKPIQVRLYQRGTILIRHQSEKRESGIYIITENPNIEPDCGSGEGYTQIEGSIYWADIKIRPLMNLKKPAVKIK